MGLIDLNNQNNENDHPLNIFKLNFTWQNHSDSLWTCINMYTHEEEIVLLLLIQLIKQS